MKKYCILGALLCAATVCFSQLHVELYPSGTRGKITEHITVSAENKNLKGVIHPSWLELLPDTVVMDLQITEREFEIKYYFSVDSIIGYIPSSEDIRRAVVNKNIWYRTTGVHPKKEWHSRNILDFRSEYYEIIPELTYKEIGETRALVYVRFEKEVIGTDDPTILMWGLTLGAAFVLLILLQILRQHSVKTVVCLLFIFLAAFVIDEQIENKYAVPYALLVFVIFILIDAVSKKRPA